MSLLLLLRNVVGPPGDTTPPIVDIVSGPDRTRISRILGMDASQFTIQANEAIQAYQIKLVPGTSSPVTSGFLVESGGSLASGATAVVTITDDEIVAAEGGVVEGNKIIKVFAQDTAGNWST